MVRVKGWDSFFCRDSEIKYIFNRVIHVGVHQEMIDCQNLLNVLRKYMKIYEQDNGKMTQYYA